MDVLRQFGCTDPSGCTYYKSENQDEKTNTETRLLQHIFYHLALVQVLVLLLVLVQVLVLLLVLVQVLVLLLVLVQVLVLLLVLVQVLVLLLVLVRVWVLDLVPGMHFPMAAMIAARVSARSPPNKVASATLLVPALVKER